MNLDQKTAGFIIAAGIIGYKFQRFTLRKKQAEQAINNILMLSTLLSELVEWLVEEGSQLPVEELEYTLHEKITFVHIANRVTD